MAGKGGGGKRPGGDSRGRPAIIIRREEIIQGGHHGGAWKVAYADFVTAMMAFFLLMWLLNATTDQQRKGIAAYFSPMATVENGYSDAGMIPGGASPVADGAQLIDQGPTRLANLETRGTKKSTDEDGNPVSGDPMAALPVHPQASPAPGIPSPAPTPPPLVPQAALQPGIPQVASDGRELNSSHGGRGPQDPAGRAAETMRGSDGTRDAVEAARRAVAEQRALESAAQRLRRAVAHDPALVASGGQLAVDVTRDGLRIQIMDSERQPMFSSGSTVPTLRAQALLRIAAHYIIGLPEQVSIGGYTDATPFHGGPLSNWTLSAGRADAARNILAAAGLPDARLSDVVGYADRHLLLPGDPLAAANRRIVLTLQRSLPLPIPASPGARSPEAAVPLAAGVPAGPAAAMPDQGSAAATAR